MKTNLLFSVLFALVAILVSSCEAVTDNTNQSRIDMNYPFLEELNEVPIVDSALNRTYTLVMFPRDKELRTISPSLCGVMIKVVDNYDPFERGIIFTDNLYDGSLNEISGFPHGFSTPIVPLACSESNYPELLKDNQVKYDCVKDRIKTLVNLRHEAQQIEYKNQLKEMQDFINTLVSCE